ncbi:hypothetical protein NQ315_004400 [Exocentrus adspersus]|uniref:Ninjurin-1 n=1 Tax=Exocentrus adspersus TaxID=1586481 RepID=A0AAV8W7R2_9CUCU|nr:hypothetical protein NQ315_004400 [Exocentrus adspersus]
MAENDDYIPGEGETQHDTATRTEPETEPEMTKIFAAADSASRKQRSQETHDEEGESTDEPDGPVKKICFVEMEEVTNGDVEVEEAEPKKFNSYAAKKTVAQGMMDIALITANANQLRYIVEFNRASSTFYVIVTLIVFSLLLQVAVGVALIFKGRLDIKGRSKDPDAKRINNYVVVAIFLVTIVNVFIASFTITSTSANTQ